MKMSDVLRSLLDAEDDCLLTLSPGPITLAVGDIDSKAARILLVLYDKMDDEDPLKKAEKILFSNALDRMDVEDGDWYNDNARAFLYAWWWLVFFASIRSADIQMVEEEVPE